MSSGAPLRIALVGHGAMPIPPPGWGAVENIIWQYAQRLERRGHDVTIVNVDKRKVVWELFRHPRFDFIHLHNDRAVHRVMYYSWIRRWRVAETSHYPFPMPVGSDKGGRKILGRISRAPYHFCLLEDVQRDILRRNPKAKSVVQPNGTEVDQFRVAPCGQPRAICVGRIQPRKRQNDLAAVLAGTSVHCDFVGPDDDEKLQENANARFLGTWERDTLREKLTDYSALALLSHSEGQPLVVAEALAAGLSVVVSPSGAANLDPELPFVYVANDLAEAPELLARAVEENPLHRKAARTYAEERFDYESVVDRYVAQLRQWLDEETRR